MGISKSLSRYLERHAEPEIGLVGALEGAWKRVVAIPACSEDESFGDTMDSLAVAEVAEDTLLLVVVNGAEGAPEHKHERNERFLSWFRNVTGCGDGRLVQGRYKTLDICLVDRASPGSRLPSRQGVGLARKISVDIPAALYGEGRLQSPWVHSTDADVVVPGDYLMRVPEEANTAAGLHPYSHVVEGDEEQRLAMLQYESYLHYYTLGLHWAGSPYAYTAIGSTIVVHVEYYGAVRGFPKREAGEDFYLLNKLAKVGHVTGMEGAPIRVRGRFSDRVPFGTGAALEIITADEGQGKAYLMYDPRLFEALKEFLEHWHTYASAPNLDVLKAGVQELDKQFNGAWKALDETGVFEAANAAAKHAKPGPSLKRRLSEWMDGFRTLKILHGFRDEISGSIPWGEAIERAPFCPEVQGKSPEDVCEILRIEVEALGVHSQVVSG